MWCCDMCAHGINLHLKTLMWAWYGLFLVFLFWLGFTLWVLTPGYSKEVTVFYDVCLFYSLE